MKIAVVAYEDLNDIKLWAGIAYFISTHLKKAGHEVVYICNIPNINNSTVEVAKRLFYNKLLNKSKGVYRIERNDRHVRAKCKIIDKQLQQHKPDVVLAFFPYQIAYVKTNIPIVIWTDATFQLLLEGYAAYRFCKESVKQAIKIESRAFNTASLILFSSTWALKSAKVEYGLPEKKLALLSYGANTEPQFPIQNIVSKDNGFCKLLFIGVEPVRKGVAKALAVAEYLHENGLKVSLTIIGPPPDEMYNKPYVRFLGRVLKDTPQGFETIKQEYLSSHFFILPSIGDATPIVFCESCSYGLPIITHDVGGISDMVKNNENGFIFSLDAQPSQMAEVIKKYFSDEEKYRILSAKTLEFYKNNLNWENSIKKFTGYAAKLYSQ
jgi:glycosyltransferase involved in cell wall biosynthesis